MKRSRIYINIEKFYLLRKISIFTAEKTEAVTIFVFLTKDSTTVLKKEEKNRDRKNSIVDDLRDFSKKNTFTIFDDYFQKEEKKILIKI